VNFWKEISLKSKIIWIVLIAVVVIVGLTGVGFMAYRMGLSQGAAANGNLTVPFAGGRMMPWGNDRQGFDGSHMRGGRQMMPFYGGGLMAGAGIGFFLLRCLVPLLFLGLLFGLIRMLFFRGWRRHGMGGWHGMHNYQEGEVPPMVADWHRKMHEQPQNTPQEPPAEAK
jgi:hypothetical protein